MQKAQVQIQKILLLVYSAFTFFTCLLMHGQIGSLVLRLASEKNQTYLVRPSTSDTSESFDTSTHFHIFVRRQH